jgi:DNA invertase Pin-like site-specific DNA recombinase
MDIIRNAISYCRLSVSTNKVADENNLEKQYKICKEYAEKNNLNLEDSFEEVRSSYNKGNKKSLNELENSDGDICVSSVDRLTRDSYEGIKFLLNCRKKKKRIHFINDDIILDPFNKYTEYSKKWNKLLLGLALSSIESDTKSDKQIASVKFRRNKYKGQYEFGRVPFGKKIARTKDGNRIFKPFNKEQNVIELIKLLRDKYFLRKKRKFETLLNKIIESYKLKEIELDQIILEKDLIFSYKDIANFLNEIGLKKNGKDWTDIKVRTIYINNNKENDLVNQLRSINVN